MTTADQVSTVGCTSCSHYSSESDGERGEIFCGHRCELNPRWQNLKSFPFKKKMKCHVLGFWHSNFAEELNGDDFHDRKVFNKWQRSVGEL